MICAYDKLYLEKAQIALGWMFDFAVHELKYDIQEFYDMFIVSGIAAKFAKGDVTTLVGRSGVELAYEVVDAATHLSLLIEPHFTVNRSPEYWTGWVLAYYQWYTALDFTEINKSIPVKKIVDMYDVYHEMDIMQFVDRMNELYRQANPDTNLKRIRMERGFSQSELAELSEIPLRTIQQYEQRQKNINKAQVAYLIKLSRALYCNIEDLIEYVDWEKTNEIITNRY